MATFYGRLQGNRGEATRCGSKDSGIDATAESWTTVLAISHGLDWDGNPSATFQIRGKYGGSTLHAVFNADRIHEQSNVESVKAAIGEVERAFISLDKAAKNAEQAERILAEVKG